jgi:RNA polymerase sigma factor (sigma-70 family)
VDDHGAKAFVFERGPEKLARTGLSRKLGVFQGFCVRSDMIDANTTSVVQQYLDELAGDSPPEPIVRALLEKSARRLYVLCSAWLFQSYPRLARPPVNLAADEMLSALVERLLKALRSVRPQTVRQFFALANRHIRWELNDLSRRLDEQPVFVQMESEEVPAPKSNGSGLSEDGCRMLEAIDNLPEEEREAFDLVRVQGLSHTEAGQILGVAPLTVKRRMNRGLRLLAKELSDLQPHE